MDITALMTVLNLLTGVALFLYGMSVMGDGLKAAAGNKLELILYRLTNTPLKGFILGLLVTAVIQSSSATTVMVVGFVNSGMMKVAQAIGIIMGANIGTSVTGWILCLSYIDGSSGVAQLLSSTTITAVMAIIGIIIRMFVHKKAMKDFGNILLGFAVLMLGMQMMSNAVAPLRESPFFMQMITGLTNPALGILFGIALTAIIQSASAAVGVLQALSVTGAITFQSAFPMTMGIGIGAATPVLLSAIGTNKNGQRTALVYLLNDLFAMILGCVLFYGADALFHFTFLDTVMDPFSVAALNTVYRAVAMILLLPFYKGIERLTYIIIPNRKDAEDDDDTEDFDILEDRFLSYPALAINQCETSMGMMATAVLKNLSRAFSLFRDYKDKRFAKIQEREAKIDKYEDKLGAYLIQLTAKELSREQSRQVSEYLHCVGDFERIGDHAWNIAKIAEQMHEAKLQFSQEATPELHTLATAVTEICDTTVAAFQKNDLELARHVEPLRMLIGRMCDEMKLHHIHRLRSHVCSLDQGVYFSELLNDLERIADHCSNVAVCMLELEQPSGFDTHKFISNYRASTNGDFARYYREYGAKYEI